MTDKIRVYAVSIMAMSQVQDAGETGVGSLVTQKPALIPATSIEEAAENARAHVFAEWPTSEGWYGHQAVVMPVTQQFFDLAQAVWIAGGVGEDAEEARCFEFSE